MAVSRALLSVVVAAVVAAPAPAAAQGGTAAPPPGPAGTPSRSGGAGYNRVPLPRHEPKRARSHKRTRDATRRRLRARRRVRRPALPSHRFPVAGPFGFGGADARFGAPRPGHRHQGQDLTAAAGTPVVAPWAGTVQFVGYQAAGAGRYVVLQGEGEGRTYVFMHLRTGSIPVSQGQRVRAGQLVGEVGTTGASSGPHLHFEVWVGGWPTGHPIDPLPLLRRWALGA